MIIKECPTVEKRVSLAKIKPGPFQNRHTFRRDKMEELAASIREQGIAQPPLVYAENGHFRLVTGERRWRSACAVALEAQGALPWGQALDLVSQDGSSDLISEYQPLLREVEITVRVSEADPETLHHLAIVDNIQRADLTPIEEAYGFYELKTRYGYSNLAVAKVTGKSQILVASRLRLLDLDVEIQELIDNGDLHKDGRIAEALLSIEDRAVRLQQARYFSARKSSIKAIEVGCKRTNELLAQVKEQKKAQTIPVKQVKVTRVAALAPVVASRPERCLCHDCAGLINEMAEELCSECSVNGLTEKCLTCPGVIEVVTRLVAMAEAANDRS